MYVHISIYLYGYLYVCVHIDIYIYIYVRVGRCMHIYIYTCICMYVYIYTHILINYMAFTWDSHGWAFGWWTRILGVWALGSKLKDLAYGLGEI